MFHGRTLTAVLTNETTVSTFNNRALLVITTALGDSPLRTIQQFETAKGSLEKSKGRYVVKAVLNGLGSLNKMLNEELAEDTEMGDHMELMEAKFLRLSAIGLLSVYQMMVPLLLSFVMGLSE